MKRFRKDRGKKEEPTGKVSSKNPDRPPSGLDHSKKNDSTLFQEPVQFIFTDEKTEKLRCNEKTIQLLTKIHQPLNVVAITGLYRTGKSYLLNRLAGEKRGFKTGNEVRACTKGIWLWCRPHPTQHGQVLVLLDVEGFGDLEKANRNEDMWLFTLATILSSTLVYNNRNTLDSYALDRLNFLERIDSTVQVSQNEEDKKLLDLDFFFPSFVIALRDFRLEMTDKAGKKLTPDEYFENLLVQKRGKGEEVEKYNKIRLLIRRYFKNRKCFTFITPCGPKAQLEKLVDREIEPDFLKSVQQFCDYIFERTPLQLKSGREITGRMFSNLSMHYVNAIGENDQPSILEATKHMVQAENQAIVVTASEIYKKEMEQCINETGKHIPEDEALVNFHELCLKKALDYLRQFLVFDDKEVFYRQTTDACKVLLARFKRICDEHSAVASSHALARLNMRVEKKLKKGTYCSVSGYDEYIEDINWIVRRYTSLAGLGPKSRQVLQVFLDGKENEQEQVYQMVVKIQAEKNVTEKQNLQREASTEIDKLSKSIRRGESIYPSLEAKIEKMESDISQDLKEQHIERRKTIQENFLKNLDLNLEELNRQLSEQRDDEEAQKEIEDKITYLRKICKYAERADERVIVDDTTEEPPSHLEEIGSRPAALGTSQENLYKEEEKEKEDQKPACPIL